jgi:gliding motility-associated protein GldL
MSSFLQSKKGKTLLNYAYGWGASIVIIGALFKIRHLPGADLMLTLGLGTEALIFFLSAFEKPHEETDWSIVYPELAGGEPRRQTASSGDLDNMLEQANLSSDVLENLGNSFRTLSDNVSKISDISDATVATEEYSRGMRDAASSISGFAKSTNDAAAVIAEVSSVNEEAKGYQEQLKALVGTLTTVNSMYEMELKETNNHLQTLNKFYGNISTALNSMEQAQADAMQYKEEMNKLARNLSSLNAVYGNMLNAMSAPRV